MQEARNLCHAERCSVFLLENDETELVAKVFDGDIADEVRYSTSSRCLHFCDTLSKCLLVTLQEKKVTHFRFSTVTVPNCSVLITCLITKCSGIHR